MAYIFGLLGPGAASVDTCLLVARYNWTVGELMSRDVLFVSLESTYAHIAYVEC